MADHHSKSKGLHGPKCWAISLVVGLFAGWLASRVVPAQWNTGPDLPSNTAGLLADAGEGVGFVTPTTPSSDPHAQAHQPEAEHNAGAHHNHAGTAHDAEHDHAHSDDTHGSGDHAHGPKPVVPLWLVAPFAILLGSIALMPFINSKIWHHHFPDFAFALGGFVAAYYVSAFAGTEAYSHGLSYGTYSLKHAVLEYVQFIALVGGLFVVSGGILVDLRGRGGPMLNTTLLAIGAVLANIVGTTGASMLLIRPFMRVNEGRLRPIHVVFFIFVVSNCGGCLTPIGDPPLYLGYIKGVPFFWTLEHLWYDWAAVVAMLLAVFFLVDTKIGASPVAQAEQARPEAEKTGLRIKGTVGLICLALMIFGVFINPIISAMGHAKLAEYPIGAVFQVAVAVLSYKLAPKEILAANEFNFFPVKEVGLLFAGIFTTMMPALGYLEAHGKDLGLSGPTAFYYATGVLSAFLDNAPTYLNFMQIAFANPEFNPLAPGDPSINPQTIKVFLYGADHSDRLIGVKILDAISTGAVFFGAMTYIGNGPNFMVKAIAEGRGMRMPSFFGYLALAAVILLPILVIHHLVFFVLF